MDSTIDRSIAGSVAAYERHARLTPAERDAAMEPAREGLRRKYLGAARELLGSAATDEEIGRQADLLRRRDLARASLRAAQARRERRELEQLDALAAAEAAAQ